MFQQLIFAITFILFLASTSFAAITVEGPGTTGNGQAVHQVLLTHDSGASGANCMTLVGVAFRSTSDTITSVTFNGDALTLRDYLNNTGNVSIAFWYKLAPARGSFEVEVNPSASANVAAGAVTYCDVNQSTPFGTTATAFIDSGLETAATVDVASAAGELVVDLLAIGLQQSVSVGSGQTIQYQDFSGPGDGTSRTVVHSSEAGASTVTMSHDWPSNSGYSFMAVSIKPAAARRRIIVVD